MVNFEVVPIRICNRCEEERFPPKETFRVEGNFKKIKSKSFKENKSRLLVGVEIETYVDNKESNQFSKKDYPTDWDLVYDGSIGGEGVEFVSPAMNGDYLFKNLRDVCGEITKRDYKINASCGLHVHINCACRCLTHNRSIGSKDTSQHVRGMAADFHIGDVKPIIIYLSLIHI